MSDETMPKYSVAPHHRQPMSAERDYRRSMKHRQIGVWG